MDTIDLDMLIDSEIVPIPGDRRFRWSRGQEAALRAWYGRLPLAEVAEKVNAVLRAETGVADASRTPVSCTVRAFQWAIPAFRGDADEVCLREGAWLSEGLIGYALLHGAAKRNQFPTRREGKQRYVSRSVLARWLVQYREMLLAQEQALEATEGTAISKQAGMVLAGLTETHFTRYLKTGVIRGWRMPFGLGGHGYWLVERASVQALVAARAEGRLRAYLDQHQGYVALRQVITADIRALRHQGRLERRDPLTDPANRYHPGCFTVQQVASHTELTAEGVYRSIKRGEVEAVRVYSGGRWRYAIAPDQARLFAAHVADHRDEYDRFISLQRRQIVGRGLLMVPDLAARWGMSPETVRRYARLGFRGARLRCRRWGQYVVFELADVVAFETAAGVQRGRGAGEKGSGDVR